MLPIISVVLLIFAIVSLILVMITDPGIIPRRSIMKSINNEMDEFLI